MSTGAERMAALRLRKAAERQQRSPAEIEARRREYLDRQRQAPTTTTGFTLPPSRVLTDWHTDETGCRARAVGNEGDAA